MLVHDYIQKGDVGLLAVVLLSVMPLFPLAEMPNHSDRELLILDI